VQSSLKRCIAVFLVLTVGACGTAPNTADSSPPPQAPAQTPAPAPETAAPQKPAPDTPVEIPPDAKIGFAVGRFDPVIGLDSAPGGSAALGAAGGALGGAGVCLAAASGGFYPGILIAIACLPFGMVFGAAYGAGSVPSSASTQDIQAAEARMQAASKTLALPAELDREMFRHTLSSGLKGVEELRDQGPASPTDRPRYRPGPDYVIEVALIDLRATTPAREDDLRYRYIVRARGRLVRVADGVVVDEFIKRQSTRLATVDQWTAEKGSVVASEFNSALQGIANAFIDEWLLVYRGDAWDKTPTSRPMGVAEPRTPDYAIRPLAPQVRSRALMASPAKLFVVGAPTELKTSSPTLAWEKLPDSLPADEYFEGDSPRARSLFYDVMILSAGFARGEVGQYIAPGNIVRRYPGLQAASVEVKEPLSPCTYYFWTVRARFELDGRPRQTEWSFGTPETDPRFVRRSVTSPKYRWPAHHAYYPFRTPPAEGQRCGAPRFPTL